MSKSKNKRAPFLLFFVKIICAFAIPVLFIGALIAVLFFCISIIMVYNDIILVGLVIASTSLTILFIQLLSLSINVILAKHYKLKIVLIILAASFVSLIIGLIFLSKDLKGFTVIGIEEKNKIKKTELITMHEELIISDIGRKIKYVVDDSLNDQIKIDIVYYNNQSNVSATINNNDVKFTQTNKLDVQELYNQIIKDFRNKKIYKINYNYTVNVYGSSINIQTILRNSSKKFLFEINKKNNENMVSYLQEISDQMICKLGGDSLYHCVINEISNNDDCSCFYNNELDLIDCSESPQCSCENKTCAKTIE